MTMNTIECAFTGRIGQEPMLKESKAGKPWLSFSVAVGEGDDVQWLQIATFGSRAPELAGSLKKSDRVYIEGRLKLNTWTGKDGTQQAGLSVAAWLVQPMGHIGAKRPSKPKATPTPGSSKVYAPLDTQHALNDPIPF
jgi:single-stranded DNA-binding protein